VTPLVLALVSQPSVLGFDAPTPFDPRVRRVFGHPSPGHELLVERQLREGVTFVVPTLVLRHAGDPIGRLSSLLEWL
jgi:hypothetical protein